MSGKELLGVGIIVALAIIVGVGWGPFATWNACRQLAPIERFVTRGC